MSGIRRRLKKAEEKLNVDKEERPPFAIIYFGGGELPPDRPGIHYVKCEDIIGDSTKGNKKQRKTTSPEEG